MSGVAWEYTYMEFRGRADMLNQLNDLGPHGWEFIDIIEQPTVHRLGTALLKRQATSFGKD